MVSPASYTGSMTLRRAVHVTRVPEYIAGFEVVGQHLSSARLPDSLVHVPPGAQVYDVRVGSFHILTGWIVIQCGYSAAAITNRLLRLSGSERTVPASSFMARFHQIPRIAQSIDNLVPQPFRMLTASQDDIDFGPARGWQRLDHWVDAVINQIALTIEPVVRPLGVSVAVMATFPTPLALFLQLSDEFMRENPWITNSIFPLAYAAELP